MDLFSIVLTQVGFFATALAVGFIAQRIGFITETMIQSMSKIIMKVLVPLLVLTVTASSGSLSEFVSAWPFALVVLGMYAIHIAISFITGKIAGLKRPEINAHVCSCSFVNSALIGYPIIMAVFPEKSGIYIAVFLIVETIVTWTVGLMIVSSASGSGKIDLRRMVTPMTIGLVIGLLFILFSIRPQNIVWDTLTGIGGTQKYIGLIYIGADIGFTGFKKVFKDIKVFLTIPVKLIIAPLCVFFIFKFIGVDADMVTAVTIFSMLPSMLIITILSKEYNAAPDYASGSILITTAASLVTMPLVFYIISFF